MNKLTHEITYCVLLLFLSQLSLGCASRNQQLLIGKEERKINALIGELSSDHELYSVEAARALGRLGPKAERAIPALLRMTDSESYYVRRSVVRALESIGPQALSVLVDSAEDINQSFPKQYRAEELFGSDGPKSEKQILFLLKRFPYFAEFTKKQMFQSFDPLGVSVLENIYRNEEKEYWLRLRAVEALGHIKTNRAGLVPKLLKLIENKEEGSDLRGAAAGTLGRLGVQDKRVIDTLISILKNTKEPEELRRSAGYALGGIGPSAKEAIPDLIQLLCEWDNTSNSRLVSALSRMGPSVIPELLQVLNDKSGKESVQTAAVEVLGELGPDAKETVPVLIRLLKQRNKWLRVGSLNALKEIGSVEEAAIPILIEVLGRRDFPNRSLVVEVLAILGPKAKSAIPLFLQLLAREKDVGLRVSLVKCLVAIKSRPESVVPVLKTIIEDLREDQWLRRQVALGLVEIEPESEDWIRALAKTCEELDGYNELLAAVSRVGPKLIPGFLSVLKDPQESEASRRFAVMALGRIGSEAEEGIPHFVLLLKGSDKSLRWEALAALENMGAKAEPAVSALIELLTDEKAGVRNLAVRCLGAIGPKAEPAIPILVKMLRGREEIERVMAVLALSKIGPKAIPALIGELDSKIGERRSLAIYSLGEMGPKAKSTIPTLLKRLTDECDETRHSLAFAFGAIGDPGDRAVVQSLEALLIDRDRRVREEAKRALKALLEKK